MTTDWDSIRCEFPALQQWTYLNTATYGQMPRRGAEAVAGHFTRRDELACSDFLEWFDDHDRLRVSIARLINATAEDIAFVPSASAALAVLLQGLDWREGDRIVTIADEFPNNLYAPHFAGRVEFVETSWECFDQAITDRTRLVLLSMLNYSTGWRPPLEEIASRLRANGTLLYVDGTQGVGALRFDARRIRPGMLAVHGYKWMLAPTGAGFMYVDPELRERLSPTVIGWRSDRAWREVDALHHGRPRFDNAAEKYEGGNLPHGLLYGLEASVDMMLELGPERIEARVLQLAALVRRVLRDAGAEVAEGETPIVAGRFDGVDVSRVARELEERHVVVSARHGHLRVSTHFYNNEADIERFGDELNRLL
jgi:selenocysteine lyase/cysteine desulfurase